MRGVLRVLGSKGGDGVGALVRRIGGALRQDDGGSLEANPGELRPILSPSIHEHDDVGSPGDVPHPGEPE
jgi:hypothetical protein